MIESRRNQIRAYVLQTKKYRESSLIADLFTQTEGVVTVVVRGLRKKNTYSAAAMRLFQEISVCYSGSGELKSLVQVDVLRQEFQLSGWAIYFAYYINELISRFLPRQDPYPEVYADYKRCLGAIAEALSMDETSALLVKTPQNILLESALRVFELRLLEQVGLALPLEYEADSLTPINLSSCYRFQADQGAIQHPQGKIHGKTLRALAGQTFSDLQTLSEAKQLMREVINFHLGGKPLKSRELISKLQQQL